MDGSDVPISLLASLCTYAEKILKPLKQQRLIIGGELASDITAYFGPHAVPGVGGGGWGSVGVARKVSPNWSGLGNCLSKLDETSVNLWLYNVG